MPTARRLWILNLLLFVDCLIGWRFRQDYWLPLLIPLFLITAGIAVYGAWIMARIWIERDFVEMSP